MVLRNEITFEMKDNLYSGKCNFDSVRVSHPGHPLSDDPHSGHPHLGHHPVHYSVSLNIVWLLMYVNGGYLLNLNLKMNNLPLSMFTSVLGRLFERKELLFIKCIIFWT